MESNAAELAAKLADALARVEQLEKLYANEQGVVKAACKIIDDLTDQLAKDSAKVTKAAEKYYVTKTVGDAIAQALDRRQSQNLLKRSRTDETAPGSRERIAKQKAALDAESDAHKESIRKLRDRA